MIFHQNTIWHLNSLNKIRASLIRLLLIEVVLLVALLLFPEKLLNVSLSPFKVALGEFKLVFTDVTEKFMTHIKIAVWWSVLLLIPVSLFELFYQLKDRIKNGNYIFVYAIMSLVLFFGGFFTSWFIIIPKLVKFSLSLIWAETQFLPKLKNTVTLSIKLSIYTGLFLQLPLVIHFLINNDLLSRDFFKRNFASFAFILTLKNFLILPLDIVLQIFISIIEITIIYVMLNFLKPIKNFS